MKQLVVTADDFGYSISRNRGIVDCFLAGAITRTSLLVNAVAVKSAVQLAQEHKIPLGLHLNLTEGAPISRITEVPSLVNESGFMHGKMGFREVLRRKELHIKEVQIEIENQIKKFKEEVGVFPQYVDGHQHVHVLPEIRKVFSRILKQYDIQETRLPVEIGFETCNWINQEKIKFYLEIIDQSNAAQQDFLESDIRFSDGYVGMLTMGSFMTVDRVVELIERTFKEIVISKNNVDELPKTVKVKSSSATLMTMCQDELNSAPSVLNDDKHSDNSLENNSFSCQENIGNNLVHTVEFMVHPGYPCGKDEDGGCGEGADEFACSVDREHEINILLHPNLQEFYKRENLKLTSCI